MKGLDFAGAGDAASRIKKALQQVGLHPHAIRRAAIVAYEAEMNVVLHARRGVLRARIDPGAVEISACDEGPGIPDMDVAMQEGYSTASAEVREMGFGAGMGLSNIQRCSDVLAIWTRIGFGTELKAVLRVEGA